MPITALTSSHTVERYYRRVCYKPCQHVDLMHYARKVQALAAQASCATLPPGRILAGSMTPQKPAVPMQIICQWHHATAVTCTACQVQGPCNPCQSLVLVYLNTGSATGHASQTQTGALPGRLRHEGSPRTSGGNNWHSLWCRHISGLHYCQ